MDLMKNLPNNSIDLIVTDPPYKTTPRGNAGNSGGMLQKEIIKKGQVFNFNNISCKKYAPEFFRILKEDSHCYIMTNHINLIEMLNVFTDAGFHFIKSLIWNKCNKIMGQTYMSQYEYILFFRKEKFKKINKCGTPDILNIPNIKTKDNCGNNIHDTEKPIILYKILIENSSKENEIVFEPFAGSDNCQFACIETSRQFLGSEIDKEYFDKAIEKLEMYQAQTTLL